MSQLLDAGLVVLGGVHKVNYGTNDPSLISAVASGQKSVQVILPGWGGVSWR
jgi:hypothetical protein